ncbi:MAG: hypothetical protein JW797_17515 [Bradymonadales bacterium]|nr:hypothetical protein [Bradymonadales bacterium]
MRTVLLVSCLLASMLAAPASSQASGPTEETGGNSEAAVIDLPQPSRTERRVIVETSESPLYHRAPKPKQSQMLALRAVPNLSYLTTDSTEGSWAFGVDAFVSAWFDLNRGIWHWALIPELGYSFAAMPDGADHLASAGIGPAFRWDWLMIGIIPRGLLGSADGELVGGVRTSLVAAFGGDYLFGAELSHCWLSAGPEGRQNLTAGLWLDLIGVVAHNR